MAIHPASGSVVAVAILASLAACSKAPVDVEADAERLIAASEHRGAVVELKDLLQREPDRARARFLLGEALAALGDYSAAESELRRALARGVPADEVAPTLARSLLYQAQLEMLLADEAFETVRSPAVRSRVLALKASAAQALGRDGEADTLLATANQIDPSVGLPQAVRAERLLQQGKAAEALGILLAATKLDPVSAEVQRMLGLAYVVDRKLPEAATAFEKAFVLANAPPADRVIAYLSLASLVAVNIESRQLDAAKSALARLDKVGPGRLTALLRARINLLEGRLPEARRGLELMLSGRGKEDPEASLLLGIVLLQQGLRGQAEASINDVLRVAPDSVLARQVLAQIRLSEGKPAAAVAMLKPALEDASGRVIAMAVQASLAAGDRPGAIALLDQAVRSDATSAAAMQEVARGYLSAGQPEKALEVLERAPHVAGDVATHEGLRLSAIWTSGDTARALREAGSIARRYPNDPSVAAMLGEFYFQLREFPRSKSAFERGVQLNPTDDRMVSRLAVLEAMEGNFKGAESRIDALARTNPNDVGRRVFLAELKARSGDRDGAAADLVKAEAAAPSDVRPKLALARLELARGDLDEAVAKSSAALALQPRSIALLEAHASILVAAKRAPEAAAFVRSAIKEQPSLVGLLVVLAAVENSTGNKEAALAVAREAVGKSPQSISALVMLAELQTQARDLAAARQTIDKLRAMPAGIPYAFVLDANVAREDGRFRDAAAAIAQARRLTPSADLALREFSLRRDGRLPEPEQPLENWLLAHPNDVPVLLALGQHRLSINDGPRALVVYKQILAIQPSNVVALNNAAWIQATRGDLPHARELAERAYGLAPSSPEVADTYGWVLILDGQHAKGIAVLENARKRPGRSPDIDYHYALGLSRAGRAAEAETILRGLLARETRFPTRKDAERLLAELHVKEANR